MMNAIKALSKQFFGAKYESVRKSLLAAVILFIAIYVMEFRVAIEATGHYSYNLLGFLLDNGLATYVLNPLHTNLYRKSLSLRKTKTDRVDARTITAKGG